MVIPMYYQYFPKLSLFVWSLSSKFFSFCYVVNSILSSVSLIHYNSSFCVHEIALHYIVGFISLCKHLMSSLSAVFMTIINA